ncbi:BatD family protein [Pseudomonas sp. F1_0610]|uniref:BatD family protein n=1 Tax=Pseudomonas sp. F1_0610 TaxID=3114284 RepID=UPI0039C28ED6
MNKFVRLFFCLVFICQPVLAETFTAQVDRNDINSGESFELTLEALNRSSQSLPDLKVLDADFKVLASKQNNYLTEINGEKQHNTRWRLTLLPSKEGNLVIPSINLGQLQSDPIFLTVKPLIAPKNLKLAPVYIDSRLDQDDVYVNAQLVLTLRIYHAYPLQADTQLSPLQIPQARVEVLGQPRLFDQFINGERFGVIQMRYAIFPQTTGQLKIPAQTFSSTLLKAANLFNNQAPEKVTAKSPEIPFTVKPIPSSYPIDTPWLPAKNLKLTQTLHPEEPYYADQAINYQIHIAAEGLPSSELPKLAQTMDIQAKTFTEQPKLNEQEGPLGITSSRLESLAILPYTSGLLDIPRVGVTWWNTQTDSLEHSEVAPIKLNIATPPYIEQQQKSLQTQQNKHFYWQLLSAALALLSLAFFILWQHARTQPAIMPPSKTESNQQQLLLTNLKFACLQNDPQTARSALDAWARLHPQNLVQMAREDAELADSIEQLNSVLYSDNAQEWQGEKLWLAVNSLVNKSAQQRTSNDESLPPLYPE